MCVARERDVCHNHSHARWLRMTVR
jgi:hypothetical protein